MKRNTWFYTILPTTIILTILGSVVGFSLLNASAQDIDTANEEQDQTVESKQNMDDTIEVTVQKLGSDQTFYLDLLGNIESASQVSVYPSLNGQVDAINVKEGDYVNKGDVLFVLGGANETVHPNILQNEIALANYTSAQKAYANTLNSMDAAVKSAELQLQSAEHQTEGSYIDYQAMAMNIESSQDGIGLIRNSLSETSMKNERDIDNLIKSIDDMEDTMRDFEDQREETILDLMDQINMAPDEATRQQLGAQLEATRKEFSAKKLELDKAQEDLEKGLETLSSGTILAENQLIGQLQQAQSQEHQLYMTKDSMQWKLGLFDGTSDPVQLAQQGVLSAKAQADTAIAQAEAGLKIAELNLILTEDQKQSLLVKAPVSGSVAAVSLKVGDVASPQMPITQIVNTGDYLLNVGMDSENAQNINLQTEAEVMIGGRYIKVPIDSISPVADPVSKLVNVTVKLPKISLKANQTLPVRFSISPENNEDGAVLFAPLDAITIGTEKQFLYVLDGNKAKKVEVKLGKINGAVVEILDGLAGDETIIVGGAKELVPDQTVIVK